MSSNIPPIRRDIAANLAAATSLSGAMGSVIRIDGGASRLKIGGLRSDFVAVGDGLRTAINSQKDRCTLPHNPTKKK